MERIRKIILVGVACFGLNCSPGYDKDSCQKLSAAIIPLFDEPNGGDRTIEIVVVVSDSAGVAGEFPMLSFPNRAVAHGHLTRSQIVALCRKKNVLSIDKPKTFYPTP